MGNDIEHHALDTSSNGEDARLKQDLKVRLIKLQRVNKALWGGITLDLTSMYGEDLYNEVVKCINYQAEERGVKIEEYLDKLFNKRTKEDFIRYLTEVCV